MTQSAASLTMSSVAAVLRARGVEVDLCLLERGSPAGAERLCREAVRYPVVLQKPNDADYAETMPLVAEAKRVGVFRRFFTCGPFATLNAARLMDRYPELDGVVMGEPEATVTELASALESPGPGSAAGDHGRLLWPPSLPGGFWRDPLTGRLILAPPRPALPSLDALPFAARDIERREATALVNLETQRGCAGDCSFCHIPVLRKYSPGPPRRFRSPRLVADEIEGLHRHLGKRFFIFNDPTFWAGPADTPRVAELAEEIIARGLRIWFMVYLRCDRFPPEDTLRLMVEAGLVRVFLGVENGQADTLSLYRKGGVVGAYPAVREQLLRYGVSHHIGFILFHPFATLAEIAANLDYLYRVGKLFRVGAIVEKMRLIPGSGLWARVARRCEPGGAVNGAAPGGSWAAPGGSVANKEVCADPEEAGRTAAPFLVDQAYDYDFADKQVGALQKGFRDLFCGALGEAHLRAEFYCTNTDLALAIVRRLAPGFAGESRREMENFHRLTRDYQALLYGYFAACLEGVGRKGWGAAEVGSPRLHAGFVRSFPDQVRSLQVAWGIVFDRIASATGAEVRGALFTGRERAT
jgi:hypothetical protein